MVRHTVTRRLRALVRDRLPMLPMGAVLVVRACEPKVVVRPEPPSARGDAPEHPEPHIYRYTSLLEPPGPTGHLL